MSTGTLSISRPRQYADMLRRYSLVVDGREAGTIKRGDELRIDVPAGEHQVSARIDWASSNTLTVGVRAGETTELEVGSAIRGWRILAIVYFITFGSAEYLYLRHRVVAFPVVPHAAGSAS